MMAWDEMEYSRTRRWQRLLRAHCEARWAAVQRTQPFATRAWRWVRDQRTVWGARLTAWRQYAYASTVRHLSGRH